MCFLELIANFIVYPPHYLWWGCNARILQMWKHQIFLATVMLINFQKLPDIFKQAIDILRTIRVLKGYQCRFYLGFQFLPYLPVLPFKCMHGVTRNFFYVHGLMYILD